MAFNVENYIKDRIELEQSWKRKFHKGEVKINLNELGAQDRNPLTEIYPEHTSVLTKPYAGQQHRMQDLRVTKQWVNRKRSTFIVLRTDFRKPEQVENYFGDSLEIVADQCVETARLEEMPPLMPMILEPTTYLENEELRVLYEPLFKRLYDSGKGNLLVYANRLEDCLAFQEADMDWLTFRSREIDFLVDKGIDKAGLVEIGDLPPRKASEYLGENIAWLKLLKLNEFAQDIENSVLVENDVQFAGMLTFVLHTLLITPIFYSHKTTTTLHDPFDTERLFMVAKDYVERILQWREDRALRHISLLQVIAMILGYGAFGYFIPTAPSIPYIIPLTVEATRATMEIFLNDSEGLQNHDAFNLTLSRHVARLGQRDENGSTNTAEDILSLKEQITELRLQRFADLRETVRASVAIIPAVLSLWTPEDPRFRWFFRMLEKVAGEGVVGRADRLLDKLWRKVPPTEHPILNYRPEFEIYDLSGLIGRGTSQ